MKEMKRYENLQDKFVITCKECGSTKVYLHSNNCGECGTHIEANCNNCKNKHRYHDFNMRLATYNDNGDEISSVPLEVDGGGNRI